MADHERLDHAIEARAIDLGLSYVELAQRAGISDVSLRNYRKGRGNLRPVNQRKLEIALEWAPGSITAVLAGGVPANASTAADATDAGGSRMPMSADELRQAIAELEDEIEHLDVRHERNRPYIVAHLQRRLNDYRRQLDSL